MTQTNGAKMSREKREVKATTLKDSLKIANRNGYKSTPPANTTTQKNPHRLKNRWGKLFHICAALTFATTFKHTVDRNVHIVANFVRQ